MAVMLLRLTRFTSGRQLFSHKTHHKSSTNNPHTPGAAMKRYSSLVKFSPVKLSRHLHTSSATYVGSKQYEKPLPSSPIKTQKRSCFHPGTTSIGTTSDIEHAKEEVTAQEMIKSMLIHIWPKDEPQVRNRVKVAMGLLISAKLANVAVPFLFKYAVDELNTGLASNGAAVLDLTNSTDALIAATTSIILGYGIARICSSGFNELRNAVFASVAQRSIRKIAKNVFLHLHNLDLSFHLNRQTGALSKVIDRGSRGINFVLSAMVFNIVPTIFELALISAILSYKCGSEFSLLAVSCVGIYTAYTLSVTQWRTQFRVNMNKAENEAGNKAIDSLINYETVKYFNNEKFEADRYEGVLKKYEQSALKTSTSLAMLNFGQSTIFSTAMTLSMIFAAREIAHGNLTVGDLVMVNGLLFQLSVPLGFLGSVYREVRQAFIDMQTMFTLMLKEPSIKNKVNAIPLALTTSNASIEFRNVNFSYIDKHSKRIFSDLNFTIPTGKSIAIVGGSGSGKSTIIRLLYRFFEPDSGAIYIDGKNIKDVDLDSLRRHIAIVPQDPVLFHDTILYNINYGDKSKGYEETIEAAKLADLHDSIVKWPHHYETQVGERGLKLSGGEKQRVAIARAILKNTPILVFDEATSSLDSITENNILSSLKQASRDKTTICIAHRLSTIKHVDMIYVLKNGCVVEMGTHDQLLTDSNSFYSTMWHTQTAS
uniref:Iron-sulfur clusters transporter ABCB7, mitochondrial n=1 Tax=Cacopsylla melanoneura TaxID=428564 RepID=A0A8D8VUY6_9HEMI